MVWYGSVGSSVASGVKSKLETWETSEERRAWLQELAAETEASAEATKAIYAMYVAREKDMLRSMEDEIARLKHECVKAKRRRAKAKAKTEGVGRGRGRGGGGGHGRGGRDRGARATTDAPARAAAAMSMSAPGKQPRLSCMDEIEVLQEQLAELTQGENGSCGGQGHDR